MVPDGGAGKYESMSDGDVVVLENVRFNAGETSKDDAERGAFADELAALGEAFVSDGLPRTENVHIAFHVADNAAVDEFHRVALAAGYRDNGPPRERPVYHAGYYGAFVLDPDDNNVEAVSHNR